MINDPIVDAIHKQREEYMQRFNFDIAAVIRDIKAREASYPGPLREPPTPPPPNNRVQRTRFARR
jgi:hypothetical protein